jgi:ubiquinone/menaquinone biosynthesis C-methylase UbiE
MSLATVPMNMTHDEAIRALRADPQYADVVRDNYLGADVMEAAGRFLSSAEFAEVKSLLGDLRGRRVVDIGAGNGMASYAFARSGAAAVYAVEPDDSPLVGRAAMRALLGGLPIHVIAATGEDLPLRDGSVDIVYCRATLHHVRDLDRFIAECARVLRSGGMFIACREHVAESAGELDRFLASHPVHRLAGGEHAYPLGSYRAAVRRAGLRIERLLAPWDSVVNAFPSVQSPEELADLAHAKLRKKLGPLASGLRVLEPAVEMWITRSQPGRLYSFVATKP